MSGSHFFDTNHTVLRAKDVTQECQKIESIILILQDALVPVKSGFWMSEDSHAVQDSRRYQDPKVPQCCLQMINPIVADNAEAQNSSMASS